MRGSLLQVLVQKQVAYKTTLPLTKPLDCHASKTHQQL